MALLPSFLRPFLSFPHTPLLSFRSLEAEISHPEGLVLSQLDQGTGQLPALLPQPSSGDRSCYKQLTQKERDRAWLLTRGHRLEA